MRDEGAPLVGSESGDVDDLRGDEGGRWRVFTQGGSWSVSTQGGSYLIDLDKRTVMRERSVDRAATSYERQESLIDLGWCRVGEIGFWQLASSGLDSELFWHRTPTPIRRIKRLPAVDGTL